MESLSAMYVDVCQRRNVQADIITATYDAMVAAGYSEQTWADYWAANNAYRQLSETARELLEAMEAHVLAHRALSPR